MGGGDFGTSFSASVLDASSSMDDGSIVMRWRFLLEELAPSPPEDDLLRLTPWPASYGSRIRTLFYESVRDAVVSGDRSLEGESLFIGVTCNATGGVSSDSSCATTKVRPAVASWIGVTPSL